MRISQVQKYRCNGCDMEVENPTGWVSFAFLGSGPFVMNTGNMASEDYCQGCVAKMRAVVKSAR